MSIKERYYIKQSPAWEFRKAKAVYRGSCNPTINADRISHDGNPFRVNPRAKLCKMYHDDVEYIDVGIGISSSPCATYQDQYCEECRYVLKWAF